MLSHRLTRLVGIGSRLLAECEAQIYDGGMRVLMLTTETAEDYYRSKHGFVGSSGTPDNVYPRGPEP